MSTDDEYNTLQPAAEEMKRVRQQAQRLQPPSKPRLVPVEDVPRGAPPADADDFASLGPAAIVPVVRPRLIPAAPPPRPAVPSAQASPPPRPVQPAAQPTPAPRPALIRPSVAPAPPPMEPVDQFSSFVPTPEQEARIRAEMRHQHAPPPRPVPVEPPVRSAGVIRPPSTPELRLPPAPEPGTNPGVGLDGPAEAVCELFDLTPEAKPELKPEQTARQLFETLKSKKLYVDATRVLAYAMPSRQAVWWACRAARFDGDEVPEALTWAEMWVRQPGEAVRRAAEASSHDAGFDTAAGAAALAAVMSGPSLGPPGAPVVAPEPGLTGHAAASAVLHAASAQGPGRASARFAALLKLGLAVAEGADRWD